MAKKIYISPSDQVGNKYAAGNTSEGIQCRKIAQHLVKALERCGFEAKTNVTANNMYDRVKESNAWKADLHVCIHTNAFNETVSGTRIFCYQFGGEGEKAARAVMKTLAPITPGTSDGVKEYPALYECKATSAPCVYVEVDFHDVDEVALWIIDHTEDIAEAICKGICNHYSVSYAEGEKTVNEKRFQTIDEVPAWARPETQELIDLGALQGNANGLDVTLDMLRTMIINLRATKALLKK